MNYFWELFNSYFFSSILIPLFILFCLFQKSISERIMDARFPNVKVLPSGKYFILVDNGVYIYYSNFSLYKKISNFSSSENMNENDYNKTIITEFKDENNNFYIICLFKFKFLYIFESQREILYNWEINIKDSGKYYNLIPLKMEYPNFLHYIISFISKPSSYYRINLFQYKFNLSLEHQNNTYVRKREFGNYTEIVSEYYISCNKISGQIFICFYRNDNKTLIPLFLNETQVLGKKKAQSTKYNIELIKSSCAIINCFVCYYNKDHGLFCYSYNIDNNTFDENIINIKVQNTKNQRIKTYFFPETNQYALIYFYEQNNNKEEGIFILDENFHQIFNKTTIKSSTDLIQSEFSFIYSITNKEYILIYDEKKNETWEIKYNSSIFKANYTNYYSFIENLLPSTSTISSQISSNLKILNSSYIYSSSSIIMNSTSSYPPIKTISTDIKSSFLSSTFFTISNFSPSSQIYSFSSNIHKSNSSIISNILTIPIEDKIIRNKTDIPKEKIIEKLDEIMKSIEIGKMYEFSGDGFVIEIKPINSTSLENSTHINFNQCENILRKENNISSEEILTFLQMEIYNNKDTSLVNQVEYQVYNDNKTLLDLSICNDVEIQIYYSLKDNLLDIDYISSFKDSGVDILNINDSFFNDICHPYSDSNNDLVLEDRIKYIYQNYSLCDGDCIYNEFNVQYNTILCYCKVKSNLSIDESQLNFEQFDDIEIESNFGLIKCYELVFSLEGKLNNIGFWIFLFLVIVHIPLLFSFFHKGLKPVKEYLFKEMKEYGYIKEKKTKDNAPPKNKKNKIEKKSKISKTKDNTSSVNNFEVSDRQIINEINYAAKSKRKEKKNGSEIKKISYDKSNNRDNDTIVNYSKKKSKTIGPIKVRDKNNKKKLKSVIVTKKKKKKIIGYLPTQSLELENKLKTSEKGKNNIFNLNLITINLNHKNKIIPNTSLHILNNYTYEEAIKYDMRATCEIFYIFLLSKQPIFHAFLFRSPLELFSLRLCLLIFIISSDLALNAIFYLDDKISEKYQYAKGLFLFAFSNNITIILLSTLIGFFFMTLFTNLSNATYNIREVFKKEELKLKKNKKYKVTEKRKKEILEEIEHILKIYKIKVIILVVIEVLMMLFFWYYVTAFCHVYSSTQTSWILDSFLSMLSRLIIELLVSLGFAKLYIMSVVSNCECLYKFVLFFYCFG